MRGIRSSLKEKDPFNLTLQEISEFFNEHVQWQLAIAYQQNREASKCSIFALLLQCELDNSWPYNNDSKQSRQKQGEIE